MDLISSLSFEKAYYWHSLHAACTLKELCTPCTPTERGLHAVEIPRFGHPFQTGWGGLIIDLSRVTAAILSGGAKMHFLKWPFVHFWLEIHEGLKQSWCNLVVMSTMDYRCRFFNLIVNMMSTSLIIHAWWHNVRKWQIRYKSTKTCQ